MRLAVSAIALAACACNGASSMAEDDVALPDAPPITTMGEPAELTGIVAAHNRVRAMVDLTGSSGGALGPLVWDDALAATAAAYAARCIDTDKNGLVDHNPGRSNGHPFYVGENIYGSTGTASAADAVDAWADEVTSYHYASNTCDRVCGHYTQVVWRSTQKVGCAIVRCTGLKYPSTILCDYGPGGNVNNQRPY